MEKNIVIQQEPVPPATQIDCIETNKVFDECLIRQCLYPITVTDVDIAPDCINDVTCSDFTMTVDTPIVPIRRPQDPPGYIRINFDFTATLTLIATGRNCETGSATVVLPTQTVSNVRMYCPEPLAQVLVQQINAAVPTAIPNEIFRLEFVGECLDANYAANPINPEHTDFTLAVGYYLVIKCEQTVQIQVLSRGYRPAPDCTSPGENPCANFNARPTPPFFPADL